MHRLQRRNWRRGNWRRTAVDVLQGALLVALLALHWQVIALQITLPAGTDYTKFYFSAQQALRNRPLYAVMEADFFGVPAEQFFASPLVQDPPLHMPQTTLLYAPFALLPFAQSFWLWSALALAAGLGACTILWRVLYGAQARGRTLVWIWIVFLAYFPTLTAQRLGQGALIFFLLATLGWWAARSGRSREAGIALGLAVSLRTFGGLLLLYFLFKRQWRLLLWSGATFAATLAASLPLVGGDAYRDWLNIAGGLNIQARNWNAALAGFFARLLPPQPAFVLTAICTLLCLALLVRLSWPASAPPRDQRRNDLTYSLALALMLLLSPVGWMYYFPIQFVGVLVFWRQTAAGQARALRWALLPPWLLSNIPTVQHPAAELTDPLGWWTWNSVYFYALLLFSGLLAYMAGRGERGERVRG
jgi:hypothetical protein